MNVWLTSQKFNTYFFFNKLRCHTVSKNVTVVYISCECILILRRNDVFLFAALVTHVLTTLRNLITLLKIKIHCFIIFVLFGLPRNRKKFGSVCIPCNWQEFLLAKTIIIMIIFKSHLKLLYFSLPMSDDPN